MNTNTIHTKNVQKASNKFTIAQFRNQFPDDNACLDYLFKQKFGESGCPNCGIDKKLQRVKDRRSYQCPTCTFQVYPTVGTIFEKSTTPLTYWFYAIYLYTATRNGVAAKELQRQLGVTYKTALRMAHQIRSLMLDNSNAKLFGQITMDETYIGGLMVNKHNSEKEKIGAKRKATLNKSAVFTMMQKDGAIITKVIEENKITGDILKPIIRENVDKESIIVTDGFGAYAHLDKEFKEHQVVNHKGGEYSNKDGYTTNSVENYFSNLKRMIKGTHISVSKKHLPKYVAENTFRYVHRKQEGQMFQILIGRIAMPYEKEVSNG